MARYLIDNQTLFLHIPRTGGTWVEKAITGLGIKHSRWVRQCRWGVPRKHCLIRHYPLKNQAKIQKIFSFVRHPIAYYESVWKFLSLSSKNRRFSKWSWHPHALAARVYNRDFNRWIEEMLKEHPGWVSYLYDLYVGPEGAETCDFIGRTEYLAQDFCQILYLLGYEGVDSRLVAGFPKANKGKDVEIVWDEYLRLAVLKAERRATTRFYQCQGNTLFGWQNLDYAKRPVQSTFGPIFYNPIPDGQDMAGRID